MGVFQNNLMGAAAAAASAGGAGFYTHQIANSVRIPATSSTSSSNGRLTQTFGTVDSNVHFTLNFWIKRSAIEGSNPVGAARLLNLFTPRSGTSGSVLQEFGFAATGSYGGGDAFVITNTNTGAYILSTDNLFRDTSAWYNIHIQADLDNGTAGEKLKIFVNGTEASYNVDNRSSYTSLAGVVAGAWTIGDYYGYGYPIQSYLAQWCYIDGTTYAASEFGETKNGVWIPKDPSGLTFGSAGHLLNFESSSDLGNDSSGNNNDFTVSNVSAHDQMLDSPTFNSDSNGGNFATLNPLNTRGSTAVATQLTEGNLKWTPGATQDETSGTMSIGAGGVDKVYIEVYCENNSDTGWFGVYDQKDGSLMNAVVQSVASAVRFKPRTGQKVTAGTSSNYIGDGSESNPSGVIFQMAVDVPAGKIWWGRNNAWGSDGANHIDDDNVAFTTLNTDGTYLLFTHTGGASVAQPDWVFNFGQDGTFAGNKTAQGNSDDTGYGNFYYSPPTGFLSLNSGNASVADAVDPAQTDDNYPQKLFDAKLYTGDGGSSTGITGVGFQPDFVWIKRRNAAENHNLYDSTRGANKRIQSNRNVTETTEGLPAFGSDGFTVDASGGINNVSSQTYVAWNWRANGGTTSSGSGDLTSTHQVDPSGGFSIVKAVGDGGSGDKTVSHGLSSAPTVILAKNRDTTYNWDTYFAEGVTAGSGMRLNTTETPFTGRWGTVNSSIFTCKDNYTWAGTNNYIYYCFTNTEGYIKSGSYEGNGDGSDGTFVYTGFKPAFLLVRKVGTNNWRVQDNTRDPYNPAYHMLVPNSSAAEDAYTDGTDYNDFLSNGFKLARGGDAANWNASGATYVYLAMAENPFQYATAR